MVTKRKKRARIRVSGPDKKGIIARVTTFLFKNNINIEDIDQRILDGLLVMNMVVDITDLGFPVPQFREGLAEVAKRIGMEAQVTETRAKRIKNTAILVTKEPHCLRALVSAMRKGEIRGRPSVILANQPDLGPMAEEYGIPFYCYQSDNRKRHEEELIRHIQETGTDLIILARYMQILSPDFCFRYEGRIINIHPSLLPAFPGALPYTQAFNKGVEVAGVTAHFATTDLDQGPIICQEAFKIDKQRDSRETIAEKGRALEAKVLCRAVKLFCDDELVLRRGKVVHSKREHAISVKAKEWF